MTAGMDSGGVVDWGRFERHAGLLPFDAQTAIWRDRLAIVGVGGIGGAVAFLSAKAGFGNLTLCDCDRFEPANILEQAFASVESVGNLKASVAAEKLADHAPPGSVRVLDLRVRTEAEARLVLEGARFAVSGVDDPFARIALTRAAASLGIPIIVPVNIGWTCFVTTFLPGGPLYEQRLARRLGAKGGLLDIDDASTRELVWADWDAWATVLGGFTEDVERALLLDGRRSYPYTAFAAFFAASLGCRELLRLVCGQEPLHRFPQVFMFDLRTDSPRDPGSVIEAVDRLLDAWTDGGREAMNFVWAEGKI